MSCALFFFAETVAPSLTAILILICMACCIYGCCVWEGRSDVDAEVMSYRNKFDRQSSAISNPPRPASVASQDKCNFSG